MEALLTSFVAAGIAEWGDKTQLLIVAFAIHYRRAAPILAGLFVAALGNSLLAAFGGTLINDMITLRAISLLLAVALVYAGIAGLARPKGPDMGAGWKVGPFLTVAICFFLVEFGDKTQFLTVAIAAQFDAFWLAAWGATAGIFAANLPAALLGDRLTADVPVRAIRLAGGALFLLVGLIVAVNALRLV